MIEAYAFLAVFTVQILVLSVLYPAWVIRYARVKSEEYFADARYAQLYPGRDRAFAERVWWRYRAVNAVIALIGLCLLAWFFSVMQSPDWDIGAVRRLLAPYSLLQVSPFVVAAVIGTWLNRKALQRLPPPATRTASLQRRGLFDLVSPVAVFLAVLAYILFAAALIYIRQHPVPGFNYPLRPLAIVTLIYALNGFLVYRLLYGKKSNPLETRADRARQAALGVKAIVYTSIALVVYLSINITLEELLGRERWVPFGVSVFLVTMMLFCSRSLIVPPSRPEAAPRQGEALS